ncbi:MAG: outer membrane protein beta-barrel domain [Crocinitomicaceae bacterium]|nr:outer membrane protein beta-barrel domain [Crocinitomicaceae bacterium]
MKTIMKLSIGIAVCFFLIPSFTRAQAEFGIAGGIGAGKVDLEHVGPDRHAGQVIGRRITDYELGLFAKLPTSTLFYVKPMAMFGYQTGHVVFDERQITYRSNNFAVPVLLGFSPDPNGPFSIEAGPVYSYLADVTRNFENKGDTWDSQRHGIGVRAGVAFDFGSLLFTTSYEGLNYDLINPELTGLREPGKVMFGLGYTLGN